jgi:hypothetical protein
MVSLPWGALVWDDATGACGDAHAVATIVDANIDATVKRGPIFVRASVTKARAQRLRVSLFLRRGESWASREVDAEGCEGVRRAAAAVVALAYELGLDEHDATATGGEPPPPTPMPSPDHEPALDTPLPEATPSTPVDSGSAAPEAFASRRFVGTAWLAPMLDSGTLTSFAVGARGAMVLPAVSATIEGRREGASVGTAAGSLSGCARLAVVENVAVTPCVGGSLGRYWASGVGTADTQSTGASYLAVDGSLDGVYSLGRFIGLRASIGTAVHASRPTFYVEGAGNVHRPSVFVLRAALGPELAF